MTEPRHTITSQRARAVAAIDTDIAHRRMKAQKFTELRAGEELTHPQIWKLLEADEELLDLEREARLAAADERVGWWLLHHQDDANPRGRRSWWACLPGQPKKARQ